MTKDEWYGLKACVADAFADLHYADSATLNDAQIDNLHFCLVTLNDYLDKDPAIEFRVEN